MSEAYLARGEIRAALDTYQQVLKINRADIDAWIMCAALFGELGATEEAIRCCQEALRINEEESEVYVILAKLLIAKGECKKARTKLERALQIDPESADALLASAQCCYQLNEFESSIDAAKKVLRLVPDEIGALLSLGNSQMQIRDYKGAKKAFHQAVVIEQKNVFAIEQLGVCCHRLGELADAKKHLEAAVAGAVENATANVNLANLLQDMGQLQDSRACYEKALRTDAQNADAHYNLGLLEKRCGDYVSARDSFRRALAVNNAYLEAHWNLAFVLLTLGEYEAGFREYEWRLLHSKYEKLHLLAKPWEGEPVQGKRIIILDEQGNGDVIQFSRYLVTLADMGADVTFECRASLIPILSSLDSRITILPKKEKRGAPAGGSYHFVAYIMSLPFLLGFEQHGIPAKQSYLSVDAARVEKWKKIITLSKGPRIGVCWAGSAEHTNESIRSCAPESFSKLKVSPNFTLFSLYKAQSGVDKVSGLPDFIVDYTTEMDVDGAFLDTAAMMCSLDLVVTIDTSIAHLAGALGIPVWVLLSSSPDWRWGLQSEITAWYPGMRLFRQGEEENGWGGVFDRVKAELAAFS